MVYDIVIPTLYFVHLCAMESIGKLHGWSAEISPARCSFQFDLQVRRNLMSDPWRGRVKLVMRIIVTLRLHLTWLALGNPVEIGVSKETSPINSVFSIAIFDYWRVSCYIMLYNTFWLE